MNKAIIIGALGKDPELRSTGKGSVLNFSVATSEKWKDKNGEMKTETQWHRIVAFGGLAENCAKYLTKGRQVVVEGRIQNREYEKDNVKKYVTEIVATSVEFIGSKGGREDSGRQASAPAHDDEPAF